MQTSQEFRNMIAPHCAPEAKPGHSRRCTAVAMIQRRGSTVPSVRLITVFGETSDGRVRAGVDPDFQIFPMDYRIVKITGLGTPEAKPLLERYRNQPVD